ncbi:protease [Mucilaginibacter sp. ZT4R22]|uniref:Protease n=1 Tax=Mucilaginibacter pankratovii TaxID=2772110 RepID=A0ABR7WYP2_9SPHI|nr:M57 family metalloprotease [Mucilaginibacter pankratovii]MBD1367404.1 protease [Mucilaginibacter pankratovii]
MKTNFLFKTGLAAAVVSTVLFACQKNAKTTDTTPASSTEVSAQVKQNIASMGFSTDQVHKVDGGYLVEGDILLTDENFAEGTSGPVLRIAESEQYRTTNLVKNLPRTVTVSISNLPTVYGTATQNAIARYNALNLTLKFQFVSSGGQIQVVGFNEGPSGGYITLGSSGFPTRKGNPYGTVQMNTNAQAYGTNPDVNYLTSVLQHEIGHCIGFRHTDYFNRAYSCGGTPTNEGASNIGAILIPGTPSAADANSWMLACSNGGDRTFNANDKVALNYLY